MKRAVMKMRPGKMNVNVVLARWGVFVLGLVIGALVVFLVMYFTKDESSSEDDSVDSYNETANYTGSRANTSLKLVFAVTRHGNRDGYIDYPSDPYPQNDTNYWPYGAAALTPVGRVQAYNLGVKLRSFYNGFLPSTFKSADIYGTSDLVERVVMSGELVLAGLYPPVSWQVWNTEVNWQPIALYTNSSDRSEDIKSCSRYLEEEAESYGAFLAENADNITAMCNVIKNATGVDATAATLSSMFDKLACEDTEGYVLPTWTNELYPDLYTEYYGQLFIAMYAGTDTMVRLLAGGMYDELIDILIKKSNDTLAPDRKIYVYSGHDTTVIPMQVALGVDSVVAPVKAGSALIVELHQDPDTSEHYVKVLYVDGSSLDSDPVALSLSDCGDPCYLDALVNSTQRFQNVSYEEECQTSSITSTSTETSSSLS